MRYISVCSGIEAATVAWHDLGWTPVAFSEIEPFPSAVLQHHYPHVPNVGDMTKFKEWNLEPIDLLVGGTPCQSFSVAGLRKGLDDPRGNLMLTFLAIAERHRPRWIVWENVPGVLSSNGGRDFGTFLGALAELGYGWAYRVLDAQWFGVAQRRRRVFVVGCLGDQAGAAAVLFESESVQRNPAPSREKRKDTTGSTGDGLARCVTAGEMKRQDWETCNMVAQAVAGSHWDHPSNPHPTLNQSFNTGSIGYGNQELFSQRGGGLVPQPIAIHPHVVGRAPTAGPQGKEYIDDGSAYCMDARGVPQSVAQPVYGTDCYNGAITGDVAATLGTPGSSVNASGPTVMQAVGSFKPVAMNVYGGNKRQDRPDGGFYVRMDEDTSKTLDAASGLNPTCSQGGTAVMTAMQVRRLTPTECERLQGFPDGYTNIPWRKKPEAPDGPRYKALGNSMAVPCMKWIGERIAKCDSAITKK